MARLSIVPLLAALVAATLASPGAAQQTGQSDRDAALARERCVAERRVDCDSASPAKPANAPYDAQARERCIAERRVDCDDPSEPEAVEVPPRRVPPKGGPKPTPR